MFCKHLIFFTSFKKKRSYFFSNQCWPQDGCPDGRFPNAATMTCDLCNNKCKTCSSFSVCTSCPTGVFLENNDCIAKCPAGKYGEESDKSNLCKQCHVTCKTCSGPSEFHCLSCESELYLSGNGACLARSNCPEGTFENANNVCEPCNNKCLTCESSPTKCLSCRLPSILKDK